MAALDLLGRRHVLRLVWELRDEPVGFRDLQARCEGLSPSTLSQRLGDLREARIIETSPEGQNALTALGRSLLQSLQPLLLWSREWSSGSPTASDRSAASQLRTSR